jgi:L-asparaginase
MAKNVEVVYTGGTAGMQTGDRGLEPLPVEEFTQLFMSLPGLANCKLPRFDFRASSGPVMDSASMRPHDWLRLAEDIKANYSQYEGFLLITGTDTMAYAASALSFFLEDISKPVILTGAQYPLTQALSDAPANLIGALHVLEQADNFCEVGIFFDGLVIRGNRAEKVAATGPDAIVSPRYPALGAFENGLLSLRKDLLLPSPSGPFRVRYFGQTLPRISCVRLFPGLSVDLLAAALPTSVRGLILETYGMGNAPHDAELFSVLEQACRRGVVIVNTTQCLRGRVVQDRYKTGYALREAGVIGGNDMTTAAAYTKLLYLLACGHSAADIRRLILTSIRGELSHEV